jgi:hypothetical protein
MFYFKEMAFHYLQSLSNIVCKIKMRRKYRQDTFNSREVRKHFILNLKSEGKRPIG